MRSKDGVTGVNVEVDIPASRDSRFSVRTVLILASVVGIWIPTLEAQIGPLSLNLSELSLLMILPFLMTPRVYSRPLGPWTLSAILGFVAMALLSTVQLLYVEDWRATFGVLIKFALSAAFILALLSCRDGDSTTRLALKVFSLSGFVALLISNLDYFFNVVGGITYAHLGDRRSAGFFEHANQYAIWVIALVPIVILTTKNRILVVIALSNIGLALLLAGSKFNFLVFFAMVWLSVGLRSRIRLPLLIAVALPVFALASAQATNMIVRILSYIEPRYALKVQSALSDLGNADSFLDRINIWNDALRYGSENPILGIGGGNAYTVLTYSHAHNLILQYFLTYGVLGLCALLGIFLAAFGAGIVGKAGDFNAYRLKCAFLLSLAGLFISNQFSDSMASQQVLLFGIVVGFTLALSEERLRGANGAPEINLESSSKQALVS